MLLHHFLVYLSLFDDLRLIADALSHVALAGIAGSLFLSQQVLFFSALNPVYLGIGSAVGGSLLIEKLRGDV